MKKLKEILERIRNLTPEKKKIFFWSVIAIISVFLFYLYAKDVQWQVSKYRERIRREGFGLPEFPREEQIEGIKGQQQVLEDQLKQIEEMGKKQEAQQVLGSQGEKISE